MLGVESRAKEGLFFLVVQTTWAHIIWAWMGNYVIGFYGGFVVCVYVCVGVWGGGRRRKLTHNWISANARWLLNELQLGWVFRSSVGAGSLDVVFANFVGNALNMMYCVLSVAEEKALNLPVLSSATHTHTHTERINAQHTHSVAYTYHVIDANKYK